MQANKYYLSIGQLLTAKSKLHLYLCNNDNLIESILYLNYCVFYQTFATAATAAPFLP
jgi:hypothetical protein